MAIILFIGIKDDILSLIHGKNLPDKSLQAALLLYLLTSELTTSTVCSDQSDSLSCQCSLFCFVFLVIINGLNLIDGIDGCIRYRHTGIVPVGAWFWMTGNHADAALCLTLSVPCWLSSISTSSAGKTNYSGRYRFSPYRFPAGNICIPVLQLNQLVNDVYFIKSVPAVIFGILILPLFDTLRVFSIRILQGKSPFTADRQHIHHRILQLGFTHIQATMLLLSVNITFIALNLALQGIGILNLMLFNLGLASLLSFSLFIAARNRTRKKQATEYIFEGTWKKEILSRSKMKGTAATVDIEEEIKQKSTDPEDGKELIKKNIPEVLPADKKEERFMEIHAE
jgi:hypothetical protein